MEQIIPAIKGITRLCGNQKLKVNESYRLSRHCISVTCGDGTLLYHTLTGELLFLSAKETFEENRSPLVEHWFFVPETFNEKSFADNVKKIAGILHPFDGKKTSFTILTTTDCNARCFYCYELGIKRLNMTTETARATAEYMAHVSKGKPVKLRWFGGEPLYNREAIGTICSMLRDKGVEYESSIVSNGYYLDMDTVQIAVDDWHLKKIQITLDGTETVYNRIKAYIDADENPYLRVMNNIHLVLESGIQVTLRLNMDAGNAEDLLCLADDLAVRFPSEPKPSVYVAMLHEFTGRIHEHETEEKAIESWQAIRNKLRKYGLLNEIVLPRKIQQYRCMADSDNSETILPDGRVGRCEHYSEGMVTGSLENDLRNEQVTRAWKEPLSVSECVECVLYPICQKLKKCEWYKNGCTESKRETELIELKEQMIAKYVKYQEGT